MLQTIENRVRLSEPVLGVLVSIGINPPSTGLEAVHRAEKHSNGMPPESGWHTIFICRKLQWYGKPLKQLGLLSRQADIRRVTGASSVN